jgi:hypothetical protein
MVHWTLNKKFKFKFKYGPAHYHEPLWFKDITYFAAGTAVGDNKCPENTARVGDRPRLL